MMNTMIPLTVANTLNQTSKQRIEAKPNQTLKQVVQAQKLSPEGDFDVYDQMGKVISNQQAANHRDSTVYVGVAKVAGGANHPGLDLDDDDAWDLDDDEPLVKPRDVIFILPSGERHNAQPNEGEMLIQAYKRVVGGPRDGSPMEVMDNDGNVVSSRMASGMVGRSFRIQLRALPGGGSVKNKGRTMFFRRNPEPHPALVPKEIIEQTTAFTQPRGRLEMGGLLIGHVDSYGNNVVVCGFFPRQDQASSGYCEFHGSFSAIAAAACDYANEKAGGPHTPDLRVIGWIHTHPDIGIFLSGIDVDTFGRLRTHSFENRCVAVVVDPIRKEHGVFASEKKAQNRDASSADAEVNLAEDLEARYHKFLNRLRAVQTKKGKTEIPFILPGVLYQQRVAMGDVDDIMEAKLQTLDKLNLHSISETERLATALQRIQTLEGLIRDVGSKIDRENGQLKRTIESQKSKIQTLYSRDEILKKKIDEQRQEIDTLAKQMDEVRVERKSIDNAEEEPNCEHPVEESKDKVSPEGAQVDVSSEVSLEQDVETKDALNEIVSADTLVNDDLGQPLASKKKHSTEHVDGE
ncbi:hypothetical protein [Poseidonia sp.]|uniref:hypothetical protein n=1 Tax=Poseidonia sp. TaxID=2666344 RepID=UPI003F69BD3D